MAAMNSQELQMVRESLGLTGDQLAAMLGVSPRTVRFWEAGRYAIPDGVREQVEQIEEHTARAVDQVVAGLQAMRAAPSVRVYRSDEEFHQEHPESSHLPARWWRHVVFRAVEDVPGVVVVS